MSKTPEQDAADRAAAKLRKQRKATKIKKSAYIGPGGLSRYLNDNPEKVAAAGLYKDIEKNH